MKKTGTRTDQKLVKLATSKSKKADNRPPIKPEEALKLWVRSGGRCAFCNKELLINAHFMYELKVGEIAHIVGWSKTSPRGEVALALDARNQADNLMLLCEEDHKLIDNNKYLAQFSVDQLLMKKRAHEARIQHLTNLMEDRETVVIRMMGAIRGASVELTQQHAAESVVNNSERFPRFPLTLDRHGIEIDLTPLPEPEEDWESYWKTGKLIIDKKISMIREGVQQNSIRHLSVFAFSRIPFLVYLGYQLDDKVPIDIFQKQRGGKETWTWEEGQEAVKFEYRKVRSASTDNVALLLSLSGTIALEKLPSEIDAYFNVFVINPIGITPNRDIFNSKASLDNFSSCYHGLLSELEQSHKITSAIHVFMAVPLAAAIVCGRGIMRDIHPTIKVYDYTSTGYQLALYIN